jgi:integrase
MESVLLDAAGHRRSPATLPGYHQGRPPRNKGEQYPADPPAIEEIVCVMRSIGDRADGHRLRALVVLLWRAGLRISEALALHEGDLDRARGAVLVRRGLCRIRHSPDYAVALVMPSGIVHAVPSPRTEEDGSDECSA